jgi:putative copper resistance protein D
MILYEAVVWLHVLAASVWIGSMAFFALVVVPVVRRAENRAAAPRLLRAIGARFRALGWIALGVLVATGAANLRFHRITVAYFFSADFWSTSFGHTLAYKLSFVIAAIGVSAIHEILTPADPEAPVSPRQRRLASWSGRLILVLSLGALYFAIALVRGLP